MLGNLTCFRGLLGLTFENIVENLQEKLLYLQFLHVKPSENRDLEHIHKVFLKGSSSEEKLDGMFEFYLQTFK